MARIAILQNELGVDGRGRTLASLIQLLNEQAEVPELFTFSNEKDSEAIRWLSPTPIAFDLQTVRKPPFVKGHMLEVLALPQLVAKRLADYDLIVASDTAVYGYPEGVRLLRLVCFPAEAVHEYEERYRQPAYRAYALLSKLLYGLAARGCDFSGFWLANSCFTRDVILKTYPVAPDEVEVLYPPVNTTPTATPESRRRSVVSIGGFHPDKRQIEQIALARRLPDVDFQIIGSSRSRRYFAECLAAAAKLPNVQLLPDAGDDTAHRVLSECKVYLHSKRNEHFGIAPVEAIAHGCIPIVHDSGGQREVAPFPELRYRTPNEAADKLLDALDGRYDHLLPRLQEHIQDYSDACFKERLQQILSDTGVSMASAAGG